MNTVCIDGRVARDIQLRMTQNNKPVCKFTIAHDDGWGDNKKTSWFDVVAWNGTAEMASKWFHKGSKVFITGKLSTRSYENREGQKRTVTEIVASTIDFGDSKGQGAQNNQQVEIPFGGSQVSADDTIPF